MFLFFFSNLIWWAPTRLICQSFFYYYLFILHNQNVINTFGSLLGCVTVCALNICGEFCPWIFCNQSIFALIIVGYEKIKNISLGSNHSVPILNESFACCGIFHFFLMTIRTGRNFFAPVSFVRTHLIQVFFFTLFIISPPITPVFTYSPPLTTLISLTKRLESVKHFCAELLMVAFNEVEQRQFITLRMHCMVDDLQEKCFSFFNWKIVCFSVVDVVQGPFSSWSYSTSFQESWITWSGLFALNISIIQNF